MYFSFVKFYCCACGNVQFLLLFIIGDERRKLATTSSSSLLLNCIGSDFPYVGIRRFFEKRRLFLKEKEMKSVRESSEKSDDVSSSKQTNVDFEIAFLNACRARQLDVVRRLLFEKRVDVNEVDDHGDTGLHIASLYRHVDVVKVLIQNGADVNAVQKNKWTALHFAAESEHVETVKVLIQNGADVNAVGEIRKCVSCGTSHFALQSLIMVLRLERTTRFVRLSLFTAFSWPLDTVWVRIVFTR